LAARPRARVRSLELLADPRALALASELLGAEPSGEALLVDSAALSIQARPPPVELLQ
jgi:hypothetical protein